MFKKKQSQVLVVGAGPVGLFTALRLARSGVEVKIIDKHRRTGTHSYALGLHSRSLHLLDRLGLAERLIERGHRVDKVGFYEGGQHRGDLSFADLDDRYPFVLVLPQSALELELEERLDELKVHVEWNRRLEGLRTEGDKIISDVARLDQVASGYPIARVDWAVIKTGELLSDFVIGADGYQSKVRNELGLTFERLEEFETFAVYEFELEDDPGHEMRVMFKDGLSSVFWPMRSNRGRWSFQIRGPEEYESNREKLNELIQSRAPWFPPVEQALHWSSVCQFDKRLAAGMGKGRVWLAGDSVHLTSPVGIQSMNAGLVDADELAELIPEMLKQPGMPNLLESYEKQRLRELRELYVRHHTVQATSEKGAWAEPVASKLLSAIPSTGEQLHRLLSQLGLELHPAAGSQSISA